MQTNNLTQEQAHMQMVGMDALLGAVQSAGFILTNNSFTEFPEFRRERYGFRFFLNIPHSKFGKITYLYGIVTAPGFRDASGGYSPVNVFVCSELMGPNIFARAGTIDTYTKLGEWRTLPGAIKGFTPKFQQSRDDFLRKSSKLKR